MMRCLLQPVAIALLATGLFTAAPVLADHNDAQVRRLRRAGEILSLETLLAQHRRQYPASGSLLEADLEFEQGRYVYELKFLGGDGVVREFEYDARTGELWHFEPKQPD